MSGRTLNLLFSGCCMKCAKCCDIIFSMTDCATTASDGFIRKQWTMLCMSSRFIFCSSLLWMSRSALHNPDDMSTKKRCDSSSGIGPTISKRVSIDSLFKMKMNEIFNRHRLDWAMLTATMINHLPWISGVKVFTDGAHLNSTQNVAVVRFAQNNSASSNVACVQFWVINQSKSNVDAKNSLFLSK